MAGRVGLGRCPRNAGARGPQPQLRSGFPHRLTLAALTLRLRAPRAAAVGRAPTPESPRDHGFPVRTSAARSRSMATGRGSARRSGRTPSRMPDTTADPAPWRAGQRTAGALSRSRSMAYTSTSCFEWDDAKSEACWRERGFDFAYVATAFADPNRLILSDTRQVYGEDRFQLMGRIEERLFVVTFT
ncbi:MAG: BrnT family toxin, partial [bacterium]